MVENGCRRRRGGDRCARDVEEPSYRAAGENDHGDKTVLGANSCDIADLAGLRTLARTHTREAVKALAEVVADRSANPSARVSAANAILDRSYGKPAQALTGEDGGPIAIAEQSELSEPERLHRIAALLEAGRARGTRPPPDRGDADMVAPTGAAKRRSRK